MMPMLFASISRPELLDHLPDSIDGVELRLDLFPQLDIPLVKDCIARAMQSLTRGMSSCGNKSSRSSTPSIESGRWSSNSGREIEAKSMGIIVRKKRFLSYFLDQIGQGAYLLILRGCV